MTYNQQFQPLQLILSGLISWAVLNSLSHAQEEYQWVCVTEKAAWAPRDGAGALTFQNKMWLLGGWNPSPEHRDVFPLICNNEVWNSENGSEWTRVRANTFEDNSFDSQGMWEGRHTAGYVVYRDKMWILGGDANQGHYQNDVWSSDDGQHWDLVNRDRPVPWGPRTLHHTVVHADKIWVIGGQTMPAFAPAGEAFYQDMWTTQDGIRWKQVLPQQPCWSPRGMIGGSAVFQGRIWILGGGTYDTPYTKTRSYYNDVWSSEDGVHWNCHTKEAPWARRQYHDVAVWDNRLWVLEGYGQERANRNDVWYSRDGKNWFEVPDTPWKPRHAASIFVHDNSLWVVAGNNMESDVWRLIKQDPR